MSTGEAWTTPPRCSMSVTRPANESDTENPMSSMPGPNRSRNSRVGLAPLTGSVTSIEKPAVFTVAVLRRTGLPSGASDVRSCAAVVGAPTMSASSAAVRLASCVAIAMWSSRAAASGAGGWSCERVVRMETCRSTVRATPTLTGGVMRHIVAGAWTP